VDAAAAVRGSNHPFLGALHQPTGVHVAGGQQPNESMVTGGIRVRLHHSYLRVGGLRVLGSE
jgi:hypothetical protein